MGRMINPQSQKWFDALVVGPVILLEQGIPYTSQIFSPTSRFPFLG
ncbi:hypothetical protein LCGC14_1006300 [marine sediment metagenome]|uniref:Uncharacterized protein n=1 Tax=marine sediment metagenome TaxID=412755 RepID=A0A0F9QJV0_9ZZZZ